MLTAGELSLLLGPLIGKKAVLDEYEDGVQTSEVEGVFQGYRIFLSKEGIGRILVVRGELTIVSYQEVGTRQICPNFPLEAIESITQEEKTTVLSTDYFTVIFSRK